jgi:hypothetical protein
MSKIYALLMQGGRRKSRAFECPLSFFVNYRISFAFQCIIAALLTIYPIAVNQCLIPLVVYGSGE